MPIAVNTSMPIAPSLNPPRSNKFNWMGKDHVPSLRSSLVRQGYKKSRIGSAKKLGKPMVFATSRYVLRGRGGLARCLQRDPLILSPQMQFPHRYCRHGLGQDLGNRCGCLPTNPRHVFKCIPNIDLWIEVPGRSLDVKRQSPKLLFHLPAHDPNPIRGHQQVFRAHDRGMTLHIDQPAENLSLG